MEVQIYFLPLYGFLCTVSEDVSVPSVLLIYVIIGCKTKVAISGSPALSMVGALVTGGWFGLWGRELSKHKVRRELETTTA